MDFSKLEQVGKIVGRIKQLDSEIAGIERYAMQAANDDVVMGLTLSIQDLTKKEETVLEPEYERPAHLLYGQMIDWSMISGRFNSGAPKKVSNTTDYAQDISNNAALQILGVLLYEKQSRRAALLMQLQSIGIAVAP